MRKRIHPRIVYATPHLTVPASILPRDRESPIYAFCRYVEAANPGFRTYAKPDSERGDGSGLTVYHVDVKEKNGWHAGIIIAEIPTAKLFFALARQ